MQSVDAVNGVAAVETDSLSVFENPAITVIPGTSIGTGTVYVRPVVEGANYEAADAVPQIALASQKTLRLAGRFLGIRIESSNGSDTFTLHVDA